MEDLLRQLGCTNTQTVSTVTADYPTGTVQVVLQDDGITRVEIQDTVKNSGRTDSNAFLLGTTDKEIIQWIRSVLARGHNHCDLKRVLERLCATQISGMVSGEVYAWEGTVSTSYGIETRVDIREFLAYSKSEYCFRVRLSRSPVDSMQREFPLSTSLDRIEKWIRDTLENW